MLQLNCSINIKKITNITIIGVIRKAMTVRFTPAEKLQEQETK